MSRREGDNKWTWSESHQDYYRYELNEDNEWELIWGRRDVPRPEPTEPPPGQAANRQNTRAPTTGTPQPYASSSGTHNTASGNQQYPTYQQSHAAPPTHQMNWSQHGQQQQPLHWPQNQQNQQNQPYYAPQQHQQQPHQVTTPVYPSTPTQNRTQQNTGSSPEYPPSHSSPTTSQVPGHRQQGSGDSSDYYPPKYPKRRGEH